MPDYRRCFVVLALTLAGVAAARPTNAPCVRPAARPLAEGSTVVITETRRFPCTVQFVNTGTALRADGDINSVGKVDDIGDRVVRGPDGRLYTYISASGQVTVWNPDGSFRQNFGKLGQGPGEFARGPKTIFFDPAGRVCVSDNNVRWSIFTPAYEFVSNIPAATTGIGNSNSGALLADGTYLSSKGRRAAFQIFDLSATPPTQVREFGPAVENASFSRRISYSAGNTFWVSAPEGAGLGYFIEQWRTDGTRLRTIRRDVPWMPKGDEASTEGRLPPPEMEILHDDGTGLIAVLIMIPTKGLLSLSQAERRNREPGGPADKAIEIYFEVIDANAGVVLASIGPIHPSEAMKQLPSGFFRGGRTGYRREEDANGFRTMRIIEYQLLAR